MKRILPICATLCLFFGGCFTISRGTSPSGGEHVHAYNYGWYLFNHIPLLCGNTAEDRWAPFVFLRDDVTLDKVQGRVASLAEKDGLSMHNVAYVTKDEIFFQLPGTDIPIPLPYILTYREIQFSGEMK